MPGRRPASHPNNLAPIGGAVFDGPYEGSLERMSAAERLAAHAHDVRDGVAIRHARDGLAGARFRATRRVVQRLRRAEAAGAG